MELRIARHTERLDALVAFYRDGLGFDDLGGFGDHDGYSGAFLGVPGTRTHLEFTSGGGHVQRPTPHAESLLVLYLGSAVAVTNAATAVERAGGRVVVAANPYWTRIGALTVTDPDGFRVVLAPTAWP